jgi:AcrR family transcriptional regulator
MVRRTSDAAAEAVLDAARELLAKEGVEALTVRRIATEAGGSTMNVYSRFGGKDGVVNALLIEGFERLADSITRGRTTSSPLADIERCALRYREFALANPTHYELMFGSKKVDHAESPELVEAAKRSLNLLAAKLERAMGAGLIRRADPTITAEVMWSACHGPVSLEMRDVGPPETDWKDVHQRLIRAVIAGLR